MSLLRLRAETGMPAVRGQHVLYRNVAGGETKLRIKSAKLAKGEWMIVCYNDAERRKFLLRAIDPALRYLKDSPRCRITNCNEERYLETSWCLQHRREEQRKRNKSLRRRAREDLVNPNACNCGALSCDGLRCDSLRYGTSA